MISINTDAERFIHTNFLSRQHVRRYPGYSRKVSLVMIILGLSAMFCFFIFLWIRIYIIEIGYNISEAIASHEVLFQENRKLRIERASLCAPSRIEEIAKNKLGMVAPENSQVVILKW
jgi:cell division protein FtsL